MDEVLDARRARLRVRLGAVVVLALIGLGSAVLLSVIGDRGSTAVVAPSTPSASAAPLTGARLFVHILGSVQRPGLYELRDGTRGVDAVASAGGFTESADRARLNLARFLVDGEQIYVPAVGELPATAPGVSAQGKVNINAADAATLETLPRVGPAMAARIIDWRTANGSFATVDDLKSVTGIGDKTFDGLKDLITV